MPFENNGILQKWHMTNTPLETDKYDTHKKWCPTQKWHTLRGYLSRTELIDF